MSSWVSPVGDPEEQLKERQQTKFVKEGQRTS